MEQTNNPNDINQPVETSSINPVTPKPNNIYKYLFFITVVILFGIAIGLYIDTSKNKNSQLTRNSFINPTPTTVVEGENNKKTEEPNNQTNTIVPILDLDENDNPIISDEIIQTLLVEGKQKKLIEDKDFLALNDSFEILSALELFYVKNNNLFPWQKTPDSKTTILEKITNNGWIDLLFATKELKASFRDKLTNNEYEFTVFQDDKLSKERNLYVCFNPKSQKYIQQAQDRCLVDLQISKTTICTSGSELRCAP